MNHTENTPHSACVLCSPLTGKVVAIDEVKDDVFSQKILGDGIAIEPSVGELRAPQNGHIVQLFDTGHALTMKTDDGVELLLHMGIDTVKLRGEGFTPHVKEGEHVRCGDLLVTFDLAGQRAKGYDMTTPMVVTGGEGMRLTVKAQGNVRAGAPLLELAHIEGKG